MKNSKFPWNYQFIIFFWWDKAVIKKKNLYWNGFFSSTCNPLNDLLILWNIHENTYIILEVKVQMIKNIYTNHLKVCEQVLAFLYKIVFDGKLKFITLFDHFEGHSE